VFGFPIIQLRIDTVEIPNPDVGYQTLKQNSILELGKKLEEDPSRAYKILSTYANISRAAYFVRCHYIQDAAFASRFSEDIQEYKRLQTPWIEIVKPM
jgi:hypothetical protein